MPASAPHNRRYFRLADVQASLAQYWREKERLRAEERELAEVPATPRRRRADGAGARRLTKRAVSAAQPDHKVSAKPCYSQAGAAGLARARAQTAEDATDADDGPGQHGGNHIMPAGSPTSWGAITVGTTLAGLSWWDACKAVGRVP
jgi:hypothetical protein